MARAFLILALLLVTLPARGVECQVGDICVAGNDLQKMVKVLDERQCLDKSTPVLTMDPIVIVTDEEGRLYYSGSHPHPYNVKLVWCHYTIQAEGKVLVTVAQNEPSEWGFRFRPKAHLGYLPFRAFREYELNEGVDAGLAADFLYYQWINLNAYVGFRSVGSGIGFDVTKNFGVLLGYGLTFTAPHQNLYSGIYFAF